MLFGVSRIIAKGKFISNDSRKTGLNNNDLIIGATGVGKSSGYVIPNLLHSEESMIVADTKGILHRKLRGALEKRGFEVQVLDFVNPKESCSYNPFDYIERFPDGGYRQQDIVSIANAMLPVHNKRDPFWEEAAKIVLESLIAFAIESLPEEEVNMCSVAKLYKVLPGKVGSRLFEELEAEDPDSFAARKYRSYKKVFKADRTWGSISQYLANMLELYDFSEVTKLFSGERNFRIEDLGRKKMVLFVNVSDTDRAFDRLVNTFYTQVFNKLCKEADSNPDGRLAVPVRIILDDFATNVFIPDFDRLISVIRSRDISTSVILQSVSQLETLYTEAQAKTILNGCDHMLYLGGQDVKTAEYISIKTDQPMGRILNMGLDEAYVFERGRKAEKVEKVKWSDIQKEGEEYGKEDTVRNFDRECREGSDEPWNVRGKDHLQSDGYTTLSFLRQGAQAEARKCTLQYHEAGVADIKSA